MMYMVAMYFELKLKVSKYAIMSLGTFGSRRCTGVSNVDDSWGRCIWKIARRWKNPAGKSFRLQHGSGVGRGSRRLWFGSDLVSADSPGTLGKRTIHYRCTTLGWICPTPVSLSCSEAKLSTEKHQISKFSGAQTPCQIWLDVSTRPRLENETPWPFVDLKEPGTHFKIKFQRYKAWLRSECYRYK